MLKVTLGFETQILYGEVLKRVYKINTAGDIKHAALTVLEG